jgi:hypothetical protein
MHHKLESSRQLIKEQEIKKQELGQNFQECIDSLKEHDIIIQKAIQDQKI